MFSLEALFCHVDDFCRGFEPRFQQQLLPDDLPRRRRSRSLSLSETLTILIAFHSSAYRNFKAFYTKMVKVHWHSAFPGLVSKRALCGMDALSPGAVMRLLTSLLRQMHWHQFYRFDQSQGLS